MNKDFTITIKPQFFKNASCLIIASRKEDDFLKYIEYERELAEILNEILIKIGVKKIYFFDQLSPFEFENSLIELEDYNSIKLKIYCRYIHRHSLKIHIITDKTKLIIFDNSEDQITLFFANDPKISINQDNYNYLYTENYIINQIYD